MKPETVQIRTIRVWDLPTRVFHWGLAACVIAAIVSAEIGEDAMAWHMRLGYAALALLGFRIVWGFVGSHYARFANFKPSLKAAREYLRAGGEQPGHNPLGAFSVYLLLAVLLFQTLTGLFTADDIAWEGPLNHLVDGRLADVLSQLHRANQLPIYALLALHIGAIVFYAAVKKRRLVPAMLTGDQPALSADAVSAQDSVSLRLRALLAFALAAGAVGLMVALA